MQGQIVGPGGVAAATGKDQQATGHQADQGGGAAEAPPGGGW